MPSVKLKKRKKSGEAVEAKDYGDLLHAV